MKKLFLLDESERERILNMHTSYTSRQYLSEQSSNAKQVGGPFNKKGTPIDYYIFKDGSKFYIYMTNASQKEPKLFDGSAYDNKGQGYPNQNEAKKMIDSLLNDKSKPNDKPKGSPMKLDEQSIQDVQSGQGVIKRGVKGDSVKVIQKALNISVDGDFGPNTETAVKTFQKNNGLKEDGIVGKNTLQKMVDVLSLDLSNIVDAGNQAGEKSSAYKAGEVFGEGVKKYLITIGKVTVAVVVGVPAAIIYVGGKIIKAGVDFTKKVISFLGNIVEIGVREVKEFGQRAKTAIVNGLKSAGIAIEKGAKAVWDGIGRLKDNSVALFKQLMMGIKNMGDKIYGKALMLAGRVFEAYSGIQSYLKSQWSRFENKIGQTWEQVKQGVSQGVSWAKEKAAQATGAVKDFFSGFASVFESYLNNEKLIMEMSIYGVLAEMQYNPGKITLKG